MSSVCSFFWPTLLFVFITAVCALLFQVRFQLNTVLRHSWKPSTNTVQHTLYACYTSAAYAETEAYYVFTLSVAACVRPIVHPVPNNISFASQEYWTDVEICGK